VSWASGYVSEIDYTHGYYRELNPLLMGFAALHAGLNQTPPKPLRYLELGFGQGLSVNIHAAALEGEFWGVDLNPSHVGLAREMAQASGSGLQVFDASFEEFASRTDLPSFQVIALHGVWSWISAMNREVLVAFIRKHLDTGGLVYVSYNAMPGWTSALPLRELLTLHATSAQGEMLGLIDRIDGSLAFAQELLDAEALYFKANPAVTERLKKLQGQNRHYLAHEYFNADWKPMSFAEVHAAMSEAKLSFAAPSGLLDHIEAIQMNQQGRELLAKYKHPVMRESIRDYLTNQQFRRDLYIRGPRRLSLMERLAEIRALRLALVTAPETINFKLKTPLGEVDLNRSIYEVFISEIKKLTTHQTIEQMPNAAVELTACASFPSFAEVEAAVKADAPSITTEQMIQATAMLIGLGHLSLAQSPSACRQAQLRCDRLNQWIVRKAFDSGDLGHLASPATGGGVAVGRFEQLFMLASAKGMTQTHEQANFVWQVMQARGQRLVREGQAIENDQETLKLLENQSEVFRQGKLGLLSQLGVRVCEPA